MKKMELRFGTIDAIDPWPWPTVAKSQEEVNVRFCEDS